MKSSILLSVLFAAGGLMSCGEEIIRNTEPNLEINIDTTKYVKSFHWDQLKRNYVTGLIRSEMVVSDTILKYIPVKLHAAPAQAPDLKMLKSKHTDAGAPLEYIAIGSSLTAGVRDGGYTNEGMLTAYPALIARQMKLAKFESPLFDEADFNGGGRR